MRPPRLKRTTLEGFGYSHIMREGLLRLPAGICASAALLVAVVGDLALPDRTARNLAVDYGVLLACALPFLIPWSWASSKGRSVVLLASLGGVALIVTARLGYLVMWLFPRRPFGIWAGMSVAFLAIIAALWLAVWAAWRRRQYRREAV